MLQSLELQYWLKKRGMAAVLEKGYYNCRVMH